MLWIRDVTKSYLGAQVLRGVSLEIATGELALLTGPSGSGKTTLLNIMAALERADGGSVRLDDAQVTSLSPRRRAAYRAQHGHVFQRSGLLGGLTARDNITTPHRLNRRPVDPTWVNSLASELGVAEVLDQPSTTLSGGQAQRVAVIRALAHRPRLLFADEPTAALDTATTETVHRLLQRVATEAGITVVMVSHDPAAEEFASSVHVLRDGSLMG